ncbi:hypothetical protein DPMN_127707 [Dreissena polymorpha]|uniref:Uncharacterized protein n=1 Tax=Dreissena polymorpha TaxID=45954 RepID=A0A9D4H2I2_DREPO|nr:hypothetical protein DPMN_127707 [Dreissena polymorpha]
MKNVWEPSATSRLGSSIFSRSLFYSTEQRPHEPPPAIWRKFRSLSTSATGGPLRSAGKNKIYGKEHSSSQFNGTTGDDNIRRFIFYPNL